MINILSLVPAHCAVCNCREIYLTDLFQTIRLSCMLNIICPAPAISGMNPRDLSLYLSLMLRMHWRACPSQAISAQYTLHTRICPAVAIFSMLTDTFVLYHQPCCICTVADVYPLGLIFFLYPWYSVYLLTHCISAYQYCRHPPPAPWVRQGLVNIGVQKVP